MGIHTLNRRTARAPADTDTDWPLPPTPPQGPALAPTASTARIPAELIGTARRTLTAVRRRLTRRLRDWTELARSYWALALTLIPTAPGKDEVTAPPAGSVPARHHPSPYCQGPGPDATA
ncbi:MULTISPECIES: hypothetical protein [Streptomyces]|uniref:hypothetical protein n=1 Tax=Streptomyces TaxID=1883 RepID=UPI000748C1B5|nr:MULTISPECIES: hypothetical protein [unclassified Streptomyces]KUL68497.1 hypothetical protein ADL33_33485 [Streptomyces sp. NRRL WC-3604]KUL78382.1 hypothetical protein ADL34_07335 [Streptomyces sp. NRRL WC-3605]